MIAQNVDKVLDKQSEVKTDAKQGEVSNKPIEQQNVKKIDPDKLVEKYDPSVKEVVKDKNFNPDDLVESAEKKQELTDAQKAEIKKQTGWSDEIINALRSMEEYEIYKKANLKEVRIGDKIALIRDDIDVNQVDEKGRTNQQRMDRGLAPLDKNGEAIQLHHIGQHKDSPLAELTFEEHRCNGNDIVLHDKSSETETHGEGNTWDSERQVYWKERAKYNESGKENGIL